VIDLTHLLTMCMLIVKTTHTIQNLGLCLIMMYLRYLMVQSLLEAQLFNLI